jgi:hypothetical protein
MQVLIGGGILIGIPALLYLVIAVVPKHNQGARLVSVRELNVTQRLETICETVRDEVPEILLRHPEGIGHPDVLRLQASEKELRTLWLYDYACRPRDPTVAY